jgi:hypothetical protein
MTDALRAHLVRLLDWDEAHATFDKAVAGLPVDTRGALAPGFEHSPWQLLEHLRIAQADILDFSMNPSYVHDRTWPDDYWPKAPAPPDATAWDTSIAGYKSDLEAMKELVRKQPDLSALVPTGKDGQTYLRSVFLVADHAAYHIGQLVAVRRALNAW